MGFQTCAVSATDFDDAGVGEDLVEDAHIRAQSQSVNDEVAASRGDLHQAHKPLECPVRVVLHTHTHTHTAPSASWSYK